MLHSYIREDHKPNLPDYSNVEEEAGGGGGVKEIEGKRWRWSQETRRITEKRRKRR